MKKNPQSLFSMGVIFVAVGVVFLTSGNKGLGAAFIGLGGVFMLSGKKKINLKK